jgi:outer membrane protein OmpA-like peptidoglycan-associated protein/outer membrane protein assembly factor BamB
MAYNPVISDGLIFFVDLKKNLYCLDEDKGKQIWKINLIDMSERFGKRMISAGKVKYPLIRGESLFITDNYVLYCLDKRSGKPIWARTGMRDEKPIHDPNAWKSGNTSKWQPGMEVEWDPKNPSKAIVDGIYADPVINEDLIYYGTRSNFISREIRDGHIAWQNDSVKSYSGFPSFYDRYVFTQSMDYSKGSYSLICFNAISGALIWKQNLKKPPVIFSPVVYKSNVYLALDKSLLCFKLSNGEKLWEKDYSEQITSNPSFTESEILFTASNQRILLVDPGTGSVKETIELGEQSSPGFVTIRDQIYIASTIKKKVGDKDLSFGSVKAIRFGGKKPEWSFISPFPGAASQPAASNGILFMPAGNYLYAIGTDYYTRIVDGGSANYDKDGLSGKKQSEDADLSGNNKKEQASEKPSKNDLRRIKIKIDGDDGSDLPSNVEIQLWDDGKIKYSSRDSVPKKGGEIAVPNTDDVEVTASSEGYLPKKVTINKNDPEKKIILERIDKGKSINVENILFEIDEAYLKKESKVILDRIIDAMKRMPSVRFEVRGHTDITGARDHNSRLSRRRAEAVRDYMIKNGISPERLKSDGFGPDRPIADNSSAEGRKKNRRTEFFVVEK